MNEPPRLPESDPDSSGLRTFGKVLLWLLAIGAGLVVLVFGTCLLMMANH